LINFSRPDGTHTFPGEPKREFGHKKKRCKYATYSVFIHYHLAEAGGFTPFKVIFTVNLYVSK
jgi:hypothetical protein